MKWKLKGSLESQFSWGKHVKEHLAEVDIGGRLRQTREGCFAKAETGERMFCQSQHMKGHLMKNSSLMTPMYVVCLTLHS